MRVGLIARSFSSPSILREVCCWESKKEEGGGRRRRGRREGEVHQGWFDREEIFVAFDF
jgi:hypothetical protein